MKIISKTIIRIAIIGLLVFIQTGNALANTPAQQLTDLLNNMKTMQGQFTQTVRNSKGVVIQQTKGSVAIAKPGKFRWHVRKPSAQIIVADGKKIWIYDVELEQVTVQSLGGKAGQRPALLLSGNPEKVFSQFIITRVKNKGGQAFKLQAKSPDAMFESSELFFKNNKLNKMIFEDSLGHRSTVLFTNLKINSKISPKLFRFKPPAGVDVIRQA